MSKTKKATGIIGKLMAGATAGATLGLVTYMYMKQDKTPVVQNEKLELKKESLFV